MSIRQRYSRWRGRMYRRRYSGGMMSILRPEVADSSSQEAVGEGGTSEAHLKKK